MIKKEEKMKKVIVTTYYCDIDGCESHGKNTCCMCKRDICDKHRIHDDRWGGDYPDIYCTECWEIGKKYRDASKQIETDADDKMEEQDNLWKEEALKNINKEK